MKIALEADSVGKPLLDVVISHLKDRPGVVADDLSTQGFYADVADRVASAVLSGDQHRAILFSQRQDGASRKFLGGTRHDFCARRAQNLRGGCAEGL